MIGSARPCGARSGSTDNTSADVSQRATICHRNVGKRPFSRQRTEPASKRLKCRALCRENVSANLAWKSGENFPMPCRARR
jgi:hypothetical protein